MYKKTKGQVIKEFYLLISAVNQSFDDIYIWLKLISLLPGKIVIAAAFFCCVCLVQLQVLLSWRFCYCTCGSLLVHKKTIVSIFLAASAFILSCCYRVCAVKL